MKKHTAGYLFIGMLFASYTLWPSLPHKTEQTLSQEQIKANSQELIKYIKDKKGTLYFVPTWMSYGSVLSAFSQGQKKGSVTTEEIEFFRSLDNKECESMAPRLDWYNIKKTATDFVAKNSTIKNENIWHDKLYEELSEYNGEKLGYQEKTRTTVLAAMLKDKNNQSVKEAFLFGIAVTLEVEKMMTQKK